HRPISSIRIAASAFSVLLTMSGSSELTPPIRFWAFSSSIALPPPLTTRTLNASVAADAPAAESARRLVAMHTANTRYPIKSQLIPLTLPSMKERKPPAPHSDRVPRIAPLYSPGYGLPQPPIGPRQSEKG